MKRITMRGLILTLAVISFSTVRAQDTAVTDLYSPAPGETTGEYLVRLNTEMLEEYILHHNTELYAQSTLVDYLLVVDIGLIETREQVLATATNLDMKSVEITNEEFLHYGDTAVLIGTLELEGSILGHTVDGKLRYMRVFVNHDGRWRLLSGSFSPVVHPSVLYGEPE